MESIIKSIYLDYSQTEEYARENKEHEECFHKAGERFISDFDDESVLIAATTESEMFGFMQGFKCAMRLQKECDVI